MAAVAVLPLVVGLDQEAGGQPQQAVGVRECAAASTTGRASQCRLVSAAPVRRAVPIQLVADQAAGDRGEGALVPAPAGSSPRPCRCAATRSRDRTWARWSTGARGSVSVPRDDSRVAGVHRGIVLVLIGLAVLLLTVMVIRHHQPGDLTVIVPALAVSALLAHRSPTISAVRRQAFQRPPPPPGCGSPDRVAPAGHRTAGTHREGSGNGSARSRGPDRGGPGQHSSAARVPARRPVPFGATATDRRPRTGVCCLSLTG